MKFLTLYQPWASLIAVGVKRIETRSWATSYRGWLGIHAALRMPQAARELRWQEPFARPVRAHYLSRWDLPRGAAVAVVRITDCTPTPLLVWPAHICRQDEEDFGDFSAGRYAWMLMDLIKLPEPIHWKGFQRLWSDEELAERVQLALGRRFP